MVKKIIKVEHIRQSNFKSFGRIIDYPERGARKTKNLFRIIIRQPRSGWRIAYLVVRDKRISRLEQHPDTFESFELVCGRSLLYVTKKKDVGSISCFLLDKPIILKKGIWHGVVTLSKEADIKIVENATVKCIYWPLGFEL